MTADWLKMVAQSGLGDLETFEATYDICRAVLERGIPGDFVECGVYAGAQCAIMAKVIMDYYSLDGVISEQNLAPYKLRVHLFDSFQGIPIAGQHDHELKGKPAGESACSMENVKANMQRWGIPDELLIYHPGLFAETVHKTTGKIAVLRLDGDLYESTQVCMRYLYPLVSRGGWVIVDDFNLHGCRLAVREVVTPAPIYWRVPTK